MCTHIDAMCSFQSPSHADARWIAQRPTPADSVDTYGCCVEARVCYRSHVVRCRECGIWVRVRQSAVGFSEAGAFRRGWRSPSPAHCGVWHVLGLRQHDAWVMFGKATEGRMGVGWGCGQGGAERGGVARLRTLVCQPFPASRKLCMYTKCTGLTGLALLTHLPWT
jgi:hypothetical protein